jgi:hypothetical protein
MEREAREEEAGSSSEEVCSVLARTHRVRKEVTKACAVCVVT